MKLKCLFLSIFLCVSASNIFSAETVSTVPVPYGPAEFPDWQKDIRRAEILSFGALPFITFMASIYYDIFRYIDHDGNEGYLPWPLKKSDIAVPLSEDDQKTIFFASAGISVGVAVFDFSYRAIMRYIRESKAEKIRSAQTDPFNIEPVGDIVPLSDGEK